MRTLFKVFLAAAVLVVAGSLAYTAAAQRPSGEVAQQASPTLVGFGAVPSNVLFNATVTMTVQATDISGVATVQANIYNPNNNNPVATVTLYDDGSHHDGGAGDEVYGNTWTVPNNAVEGRYSVKIEANDLLGNVTSPLQENGSFNVGGVGVVITSPLDGDWLATASLPVQITAGDTNGLSSIELYDGATRIFQQDVSGSRFTVTFNWDTHAIRGQKTIQARSIGGSGTYLSNLVNLTINNCIVGQPGFDETICTALCTSFTDHLCVQPKFSGEQCDDVNYNTYAGFDCRWNQGCCYPGSTLPGTPPNIGTLPFSIIDPIDGATINTQTYAVIAQAVAEPTVGPDLKARFYLDGVEVDDQFYGAGSDPNNNIYQYQSIYTLASGAHTVRARLYNTTNYDPADPTTYHDSSNVNITVSITVPTVLIEFPVNNSIVSGLVPVLVTADYTSDITRIALYDADTTYIGEYVPNPPAQHILRELINWNTALVFDGLHHLYAVAYSGANVGYSDYVTVTVDNANPTISFSKNFIDSLTKAGGIVGGGSGALPPSKPDGSVSVAAEATDAGSGVARVEFFLNGILQSTDTTPPFNWLWTSNKSTNGDYDLTATVYDRSGKSATTEPQKVTLDHCAWPTSCDYAGGYICCAGLTTNACEKPGTCLNPLK
jgi:hypothetical protein